MPSSVSHKDISKFLSLVLRHAPAEYGLDLRPGGWASIEDIVECAPWPISAADVRAVNDGAAKKRFTFSADQMLIRADYGHSVDIELGYEPAVPPVILYHGTATQSVPSILAEGIHPGRRLYVHLSAATDTARIVGARHGRPTVLAVKAGLMHEQGHVFYGRPNGVWLTEFVPTAFIEPPQVGGEDGG